MMSRKSFYLGYFASHIPTTVFIDCLPILPLDWRWRPAVKLVHWYIDTLNDPLMGSAMADEADGRMVWFKTLLYCETLIQLPIFLLIIWGLTHDRAWTPVLLLAYAVHALTTVAPCLSTLVTRSLARSDWSAGRLVLLSSLYAYYGLVSLYIIVDTAPSLVRVVEREKRHGKRR